MALKASLRWRVVTASAVALALAAAAMTVALVAAAGIRAEGRQLSQRLVPAAAAAGTLLEGYQTEQNWLRGYVTAGHPGPLTALDDLGAGLLADQDRVALLARGYPAVTRWLAATVAAHQSWRGDVAEPELEAMARGDVTDARALQAEISRVRPYLLAIRSAGSSLQDQITDAQQRVTNELNSRLDTLLGALIAMCVVVAALAAGALAAVWHGLLRPVRALRQAMASVTAGDYDTRIPAAGPAELADLGRGAELMRLRMVAALDDLQRAEQRFRRVFDAAPDAMIAVAADGAIAMANAQAVQLFGYPAGSLIGQPAEMLVPAEARAEMAARRASYFADPPSRPIYTGVRMSGQRRDGSRFPAEITLSELPTDSGILVTAAIRDVTERLPVTDEDAAAAAVTPAAADDRETGPGSRLPAEQPGLRRLEFLRAQHARLAQPGQVI